MHPSGSAAARIAGVGPAEGLPPPMPAHHLPFDAAHPSPYREALARGQAKLRFEPGLERAFRKDQHHLHVLWLRWVLWIGIGTYLAFIAIDLTTIPLHASRWTAAIRLFLIVPALAAALVISHRPARRVGHPRRVRRGTGDRLRHRRHRRTDTGTGCTRPV